jgi:hypothetical protein
MMWQAVNNQQTEEKPWLTKSQDRSRIKRAAVGQKRKLMELKRAGAAGLCSTPVGMMVREIMCTPIGVGSRAGGAAR